MDRLTRTSSRRKRKADLPPENNERLSKRLSLLNLGAYILFLFHLDLLLSNSFCPEHSGAKLYVPVENPLAASSIPSSAHAPPRSFNEFPISSANQQEGAVASASVDETMQVDDTKYKVYIYNIDDELSSDSEPEDGNGKLVFLPDIEQHLRAHRIPPHVLVDPRAEAAGKELVLYSIPRSISVPEGNDSVRKAIIEARARVRERQQAAQARAQAPPGEEIITLAPATDAIVDDIDLTAPVPEVEGPVANGCPLSVHSYPESLHMDGGISASDGDEMELD